MSETLTKHLPRTFMSKVRYSLTIRAFDNSWTASYEWCDNPFAEITAHSATLEEAVTEMIYIFDHHEDFKHIRESIKVN